MDTPMILDDRFKFRHLQLVDALSRQGSVSGAAAELHISQPVATRNLREIEMILGVRLFERNPQGVTATAFGCAFTIHARAVLARLDQAGCHLVELAHAVRGTVTVGTDLAGTSSLLPGAIARLKARHPLVVVTVREGHPDQLLFELEAGRIDLIVGRLTSCGNDGARSNSLYYESIQLVAGSHHPLSRQSAVSLEDAVDYPWILPGRETVLRYELETLFARSELPDLPDNLVEATSFLTVRQLLAETDMIAALPSLVAQADSRLISLPVELDSLCHHIGTTVWKSRGETPGMNALLRTLALCAKSLPQSDRSIPAHPKSELECEWSPRLT